jgi:hypothetical protein
LCCFDSGVSTWRCKSRGAEWTATDSRMEHWMSENSSGEGAHAAQQENFTVEEVSPWRNVGVPDLSDSTNDLILSLIECHYLCQKQGPREEGGMLYISCQSPEMAQHFQGQYIHEAV